jgi:AAA family ATP:ADP antiporter
VVWTTHCTAMAPMLRAESRADDRVGTGTPAPPKHSRLERVLSVVADIEPGEGVTALLLTLDIFLILTAYYVIKPVREGLILEVHGGAEYKSYTGAAIATTLFFGVPIYARFARRLDRNRLLLGVNAFFISNLLGFAAVMFVRGSLVGHSQVVLALAFFLWVGVFNMMMIAQFWAFANDIYSETQGRRLFAFLGLGASVGAAFGSLVLSALVRRLGIPAMLLLGACILVLSTALSAIVHKRETKRLKEPVRAVPVEKPVIPTRGAYSLVLRDPYLLSIVAFTVVFTLINSDGEYILSRLVKGHADTLSSTDSKAWIAAYYGKFFFYVNVVALVVQTFAVSRILKLLELRHSLVIVPLLALASATSVALFPFLAVYRFGKGMENASDYSLNNTLRNALWLPTSRDAKYVGKQAVDSFFVRFGDVLSAGVVFLFADQLDLGVRTMATINVCLAVVWVFLARSVASKHEKLTSTATTSHRWIAEPGVA